MVEIAKKIAMLRKTRGLTQTELAKILHLSKQSISFYESGARNPDYETLIAISKFFGVTVGWFFGEESEPAVRQSEPVVRPSEPAICIMPAPSISDDEKKLLDRFRALDDEGREYVLATALTEKRRVDAAHPERKNDCV